MAEKYAAPWLFLAIITVILVCSEAKNVPTLAPKFAVNLDLPPEQRWTKVVNAYRSQIGNTRKIITGYIPEELMPLVEFVTSQFKYFLPETNTREIEGIARVSGLAEGDIFLLNCLYELITFCTSIVAQDSRGIIWHGRNFDYGDTPFQRGVFRNLTIQVDYIKNGKILYSGTTIVGYTGIHTGQRPGAFSISLDERRTGTLVDAWKNLFMALLGGGAPDGMVLRQVLENMTDFESAVTALTTRRLITPAYYIIGGVSPGQGAIITRNRWDAADVWRMDPDHGRWFLVETNYDHWQPSPDPRRYLAMAAMRNVTQAKLDNNTLFSVMNTTKVANTHTILTSILCPKFPTRYQTWVRFDAEDLVDTPLSLVDRVLNRFPKVKQVDEENETVVRRPL